MVMESISKNKWYLFFLFVTTILFEDARSQNLSPAQYNGQTLIDTYTPEDYNGSPQNLYSVQDAKGYLYFGTTEGIQRFNGTSWNKITTRSTVIRSLASGKDSIVYVGGIGEFGMLKWNQYGDQEYISLSDSLHGEDKNFSDVWAIHAASEGLYFQSHQKIHFWDGKSITTWGSQALFSTSFYVNGMVYVNDWKRGLYFVENGMLKAANGGIFYAERRICSILPYTSKQLLIVTQDDGLYIYDGNSSLKLKSEVEDYLKKHPVYCGAAIPDGTYMLGTRSGGAVWMNRSGQILEIFDENNGLINNFIFHILLDKDNYLWFCTYQGLNKLELLSPTQYFNKKDGLEGVVLNIALDDHLYAATTSGLYKLDPVTGKFKVIDGMTYEFLDVEIIGDEVIGGSSNGIYAIKGDKVKQITSISAFDILPSKYSDNIYAVGNSRFLKITKDGDEYKVAQLGSIPSVNLGKIYEIDSTNFLCLGFDMSAYLVKVENDTITTHAKMDISFIKDILACIAVHYKGKQYFILKDRVFFFDNNKSDLIRVHNFWKDLGFDENQEVIPLYASQKGIYVTITDTERQNDFYFIPLADENQGFKKIGIHQFDYTYHLFYKEYGQDFWFGGTTGLMKYSLNHTDQVASQIPDIRLEYVIDNTGEAVSITDPRLRQDQNSLIFNFSLIDFSGSKGNSYQYYLEGFDEGWSKWSTDRKKEYSYIPPGRYAFHARGRNIFGNVSETISFPFHLPSPWYASMYARIIYLALFLAFLYTLFRFQRYLYVQRTLKLEAIIGERTAILERQTIELTAQANRLQEMDIMKSRFFANISHEFRTPLTLILSPVESVLKQAKKKAISKAEAELIQQNARRLLRLVNQILDLAKIDAQKMKLFLTGSDITGFIESVTSAFNSLSEYKQITYTIRIQQPDFRTYYDADKLEKILYNLISNALKFTPEGGQVDVSFEYQLLQSEGSDYHWLRIVVKDSGVGIPPELLPKIFKRFYHATETSQPDVPGTGIGLELTKELVDLQKGSIDISSDQKGSVFTVMLPVDKTFFVKHQMDFEEVEEIKNVNYEYDELKLDLDHETEMSEDDYITGEKKVLLIAEDNKAVRKYVRQNIGDSYHYIEAGNGQMALEKSLEIVPDLIISDMMMPVMDGISFCREIKSNIKTSHIPVIILTARAALEDKIEGLDVGADGYLIKPYNPEELQHLVENLLRQRERLKKERSGDIAKFAADIEINDRDKEFIKQVIEFVESNISDATLSVERLQKALGMSRMQLHRKLKATTGQSPADFIKTIRLKRAAALILKSGYNITQISYEVGFSDPSYFTKAFRKMFDMTPKEYLQRNS